MRVFIESRERFVFRLRQQEILDGIRTAGLSETPEQAEVESALARLCEWGNLQADAETTGVSAVDDFYDQCHAFRMTRQGEAAERASARFDEILARDGALPLGGVADIRS